MRAAKFAISMPAETMKEVDRAARRLGMTRSRYIATVLHRVAAHERDRSLSRKIDRALAAIEEAGEQDLAAVAHLASARRDEGTEW